MKGDNVLSRYKIKGTDQILIFSFESYERNVRAGKNLLQHRNMIITFLATALDRKNKIIIIT